MTETPTKVETPAIDPDKPGGVWSSRKFSALMFAMATNKLLLGIGLYVLKDNVEAGSAFMWWWMISLTIVDGFLSTGGILGIAYVDRYAAVVTRVVEGATGEGKQPPF